MWDPAHLSDYSSPPQPHWKLRLLPHGLSRLRSSFQFTRCRLRTRELSSGGVGERRSSGELLCLLVWTAPTMDHSVFGCLRSPHAPTQGLHPAVTPSALALHHRSHHMFTDVAASSPSYDCSPAEDSGVFGGSEEHKQPILHPQNTASWPGPLHSVCGPPPEAPQLRTGSPNQRGTRVQPSEQTGTTCSSCEEPDGKNQSSGRASPLSTGQQQSAPQS